MAETTPRYAPLIHLSSNIQIGATDTLVTMGKMLARETSPADRSYFLGEIEKHLARMTKSVAYYRGAMAAGGKELTTDEYHGVGPADQGEAA
jgi:hypothetical protein